MYALMSNHSQYFQLKSNYHTLQHLKKRRQQNRDDLINR